MNDFSAYKNSIWLWYSSKNPNEKKIILVLALLISLTFLIYGILKPSYQLRLTAQKNYQNAQGLLWQLQALPTINTSTSESGSLLSTLNSSATELNIVLARVEPEGDNIVRVSLDKADFNHFSKWLVQLETQKIRLSELNVERDSNNDGVMIRAKFNK